MVKEGDVIPRNQGCANKVPGGTLLLTAPMEIEDPSFTRLIVRVTYKTKAEGDLNCPHGIVMDRRGAAPMLLVADRTNKRLQYFTLDGKFHSFAGGVKSPCHFDQFKNGDLLVPDLEARVTLLDKKNNVILHLGEDDSGKEQGGCDQRLDANQLAAQHLLCQRALEIGRYGRALPAFIASP